MGKKLLILGSGLAGLIANRMLANQDPTIIEKQEALPNNHAALLRFRSDKVSNATNIPFQKVVVQKAVHGGLNSVADSILYSKKVSSKIHARSILDLKTVERWIAPPDLVQQLAVGARIQFGTDFEDLTNLIWKEDKPVFISTIPMPAMMALFKWPEMPNFSSTAGWTARGQLRPELESSINCTMYFPGDEPWYRASITGSQFIIEGNGERAGIDLSERYVKFNLLNPFGLSVDDFEQKKLEVKASKYQKISELNTRDRESAKRFVMWLSEKHSIFSLGRFATWRPKVLLDDLVQDVRIIRDLIDGFGSYESRMKR